MLLLDQAAQEVVEGLDALEGVILCALKITSFGIGGYFRFPAKPAPGNTFGLPLTMRKEHEDNGFW